MADRIRCDKKWLNEHGAIVEYTDVAIAPSKDFFHVFVTPDEVVLDVWKIEPPTRANSHRPPIEYRDKICEFEHNDRCHSEIRRVAGEDTLNYIKEITKGHIDYLIRMPRNLLMKIIVDHLGFEDINRLSRVNKLFRSICHSNELWEQIYRKYSERPITQELEMLAAEKGWERLFFTNRLQLQMQLRRMMMHEQQMDTSPAQGGHAFLTQEQN